MDAAFDITDVRPLDAKSFVPLYVQLAEQLSGLIEGRGEAVVGKVLPSEAECVQHLNVSRPTVRQAMDHLARLGLIVREKGRGTFVAARLSHDMAHGFEHEMAAAHRDVQLQLLDWRLIDAPDAVRAALQLDAAGRVWFLRRLRFVDGIAVGIEERYFPEVLGALISERDAKREPMVVLLRNLTSQRNAHLDVDVSSDAAGKELARLLGVKPSTPVLTKRLTYVFEGKPLAYGTTLFLSEHYQFRFSVNLPLDEARSPM